MKLVLLFTLFALSALASAHYTGRVAREAAQAIDQPHATITTRSCALMNFTNYNAVAQAASGSPFTSSSDMDCYTSCNTGSNMGWTRQQSTDECYCINQPFGTPSAYGVTNWNSGWYPNGDVVAGCPIFYMPNQRIWSTETFATYSVVSADECAAFCVSAYGSTAWAIYYGGGTPFTCYCVNKAAWSETAQTANDDWAFGMTAA